MNNSEIDLLMKVSDPWGKIIFVSPGEPKFAYVKRMINSYVNKQYVSNYSDVNHIYVYVFNASNSKWDYISLCVPERYTNHFHKKYKKITFDINDDKQVIEAINLYIKHDFEVDIRRYQRKIDKLQPEIDRFKSYINPRREVIDYIFPPKQPIVSKP